MSSAYELTGMNRRTNRETKDHKVRLCIKEHISEKQKTKNISKYENIKKNLWWFSLGNQS